MRKRITKKKLPKLNGRTVKNESEYNCFQKLKEILPRGSSLTYETQKIPYTLAGTYLVDFTIVLPKKQGGREVVIEYKGAGRAWDSKVRQKMIAARDQNPDIDLKIVFHRDAPFGNVRKDGTKQKQSDWAERHGFDYCIGWENIPKEWFE